ncbi:MAG: ankyrin repeat domain-containing protein [Vicinamibacterales bacterium]
MARVGTAVLGFVFAAAALALLEAQTPARVDFQRDVQPILREHCYTCHGPEQQMSGLRLDRRADAMRGSTQSVIGPGNADGSKLYHRLVGKSGGSQMPPTGSIGAEKIAVIKAWIDQGAEWPDQLSGVLPSPPVDADAEQLAAFIREGDRAAVARLLRTAPRAARARTSGGSTPLMFAGLYGDAALMKRFIDLGADPNASNTAGATALMWAVPHLDRMRVLLASDVDVDARSEDRRTALVIAAGIGGSLPAVRLLLDYGASPLSGTSVRSALLEAARAGNVEVFRLLLDYGAERSSAPAQLLRTNCVGCAEAVGLKGADPTARVPPPDTGLRPTLPPTPQAHAVGATPMTPAAVRAAVDRSLPLLQRIGRPFIEKTGCVSCHHNSLVSFAVSIARRNGYRVDEASVARQRDTIATYLESWRERALQNVAIAGAQDTASYLLFGLAADAQPPDRSTDAQARLLMRRQLADGRWPLSTLRPPIESNDIEVTAVSLRAVQHYAPRVDRTESLQAVARARDWLASAHGETTEERAFRVLGLRWADADPGFVTAAVRELLTGQRADGGWSQQASMESDAYASGEALIALRAGGRSREVDSAVRRGVEFLLRTQLEDGTWFVKSRAVPIQAYFESGFPHGADQWISAAATAWAVGALAEEK